VIKARADVQVAQERYDTALDALRALQTGADSLEVLAAGQAVSQAQAVYAQAQSAVAAAQASLDLIDTQIEKLTVRAPIDGVVLTRSIQAGKSSRPARRR
jgi:HlyD family secretion protein